MLCACLIKAFWQYMKVNYCIVLLLVLFFNDYLCICDILHMLGQSHNVKKSSLPLCSAYQEDPVASSNSDRSRNRFPYSPSCLFL